LDGVEKSLIQILREGGGVMSRAELELKSLSAGIKRNTLEVYLSYSPVINRYAPAVYGVRGSDVEPGAVEALRPRQSRREVLQDYGWTKDGRPWIGYRLSESTVRSGVVTIPANMKRFVSGEYSMVSEGGETFGELNCQGSSAWGLRPIMERRGLEAGDFLMITIDESKRAALIRYATEELWEPDIETAPSGRNSSDSGGNF
jgi:hypothetical protein